MQRRLTIGVLGGAGFIGRRLVQRLVAAGHRVRVGDLRAADIVGAEDVRCDITSPADVDSFVHGLDIMYNLAAEHRDDVRPLERYAFVNVRGSEHVCEAASRQRVRRIVFTSSVAVYGVPEGAATEDAPCRPFNEYGRTKLAAEQVYRNWANEDVTRNLIIVRPTVVFGEGNRGNVFNLAKQIASRRFVMVGDGQNQKSMAYVENVAAFLVHALSLDRGTHTLNYADGPDFDMNTLVGLMRSALGMTNGIPVRLPYALGIALGRAAEGITALTGKSLPFSAVRVQKFCASTRIASERARAAGFTPAIPLEDALGRFLSVEFPRDR
jgi:GlcNAc-P-P-Und epimerase